MNLSGSKDAQLSGQTWFLGVFLRVFPESINVSNWQASQRFALSKTGEHHSIDQKAGAARSTHSLLRRGIKILPLVLLVLKPSGSDQNLSHQLSDTAALPGSPTCRQQMAGLLSLLNHASQSMLYNKFLSVYIYPIVSFPLENLLI